MAMVHQISKFDTVEVLEPIAAAPAGAQGGVLEFLSDGNVAEIEIMKPDLEGLDRIVYVPLSKLRRVEPTSTQAFSATGPPPYDRAPEP